MRLPPFRSASSLVPLSLSVLGACTALTAQCVGAVPGLSVPGIDGGVSKMVRWDPDLGGPLPEQVVIVGGFAAAGGLPIANLALFEPVSGAWSSLGAGPDGGLSDVAVAPNNDLVVTGGFTTIGGVPAASLARFDGVAWSEIGGGLGGPGLCVAVEGNGNVVVGGLFGQAGAVPVSNIARWNGTSWFDFLGGLDSAVSTIIVRANGALAVGGQFSTAFNGGVPLTVNRVAQWGIGGWTGVGGGIWIPPGSSLFGVTAIAEVGNALFVGGDFTGVRNNLTGAVIGANNLASFGLGGWVALGGAINGTNGIVAGLRPQPGAGLVVCGGFNTVGTAAGTVAANGVAILAGGAFGALGTGLTGGSFVVGTDAATLANGDVLVGGFFDRAGGVPVASVARSSAGVWSALAAGAGLAGGPLWSLTGTRVSAVAAFGGTTVVGGAFLDAGGTTLNNVASWNGTAFAPLGAGFDGEVRVLARMANGNLFAGGSFLNAGTTPVNGAAEWDGTTWRAMAGGVNGSVAAAVLRQNGELVLGGTFTSAGGVAASNVAVWTGSSWRALGAGLSNSVFALAEMQNGTLVAGGQFQFSGTTSTPFIAQWTGASWRGLGAGTNAPVLAFAPLPNGSLAVGGQFTVADGVAASGVAGWDGSSFSALAGGLGGTAQALAVTSSGDLIAGGAFHPVGGGPGVNLARWDGTQWTRVGAGTDRQVRALALVDPLTMAVGGDFTTILGNVAARFGTLVSTCLPGIASIGAGCVTTTLVPNGLPLVGTTYRATASGMPANAIAIGVLGLTNIALPLTAALPQADPSCMLFPSLDVLTAHAVVSGSADVTFTIAAQPAFVGQVWFHQVVALEFDTTGAIIGATSSDAFALTIGAF